MKIYTYYENLSDKPTEQLLELWKDSWTAQGFEPVVLSKADAEKHPYYEEFMDELGTVIEYLTDEVASEDNLTRWRRWLAFATVEPGRFYVSDYDVINRSFKPQEISSDHVKFYNRFCTCFVSGTAESFAKLCKDMIRVTKARVFDLKKLLSKPRSKAYNLQHCLTLNFSVKFNRTGSQAMIEACDFIFSNEEELLSDRGEDDGTCKLVHLSNKAAKQQLLKDPRFTSLVEQKRIELALHSLTLKE